jgi:hypothetical protein
MNGGAQSAEQMSREGAQMADGATIGNRVMAMEVLAAVLEHHRGAVLSPIVDALEAAGLAAGVVLDKAGRVDLFRINVVGELSVWTLARADLCSPWYGRPAQGPAPWGFGPAPQGRELAARLLGLSAAVLISAGVH